MALPEHSIDCRKFGLSGSCPACYPIPTCKNCGHSASAHHFSTERITFQVCPGCLECVRHANPFVAEDRTRFMSFIEDNEHLVFVSEESLDLAVPGQLTAIVMQWWAVHPQRGLILWRRPRQDLFYPQTNVHQDVAEKLTKDLYPWAEVKQIPLVLLRHSGMPFTKKES